MSEESNSTNGKRPESQHAFGRTDSRSGESGDFGPWTLDLGLPKNWPTPCCSPTMVDANPHLRSLSPQDWEFLFRETLLFAHYQVQRLRWRGSYGGIMPDGFDPNSLAAQAFLDLLLSTGDTPFPAGSRSAERSPGSGRNSADSPTGAPSPGGEGWGEGELQFTTHNSPLTAHARVSVPPCAPPLSTIHYPQSTIPNSNGELSFQLNSPDADDSYPGEGEDELSLPIILVERTTAGSPTSSGPFADILYQLRRLVLRHVTRLHHRKENFALSNAEDLAPVQIDDEEEPFTNPIELIPDDPARRPDAVLLARESLDRFDLLESRFSSFIAREPRLLKLFNLRSQGIDNPQMLARRLKLRRRIIENLQKKLRRRWRDCFSAQTHQNAKNLSSHPIVNQ